MLNSSSRHGHSIVPAQAHRVIPTSGCAVGICRIFFLAATHPSCYKGTEPPSSAFPSPAMPYSAELSRANPTCLLFLIDQSSSMAEPFGAQPDKPKAEGVADGINRLLQNLALKCAKGDGMRDYFHVGVIGYGGRVAWALGGQLAGQKLVPISVLANHPLKVEQRTQGGRRRR